MSSFYRVPRSANWNFGGKNWKLSRSKIDLFFDCPRCFYLDNKLGIKRPPGFPFNLNTAVDTLLKREFDMYREREIPHPLMEEYDIPAVPFVHEDLEKWRDNFTGITAPAPEGDYLISGAVDDLWGNDDGDIHVVDYKATSKDGEVGIDAPWQISYKRQIEVYQWLLRENNFSVSDIGYFVYCNGNADSEDFSGRLDFDIKVIAYEGNTDWVEPVLSDIHSTLLSEDIPEAGPECDFCKYRSVVDTAVGKKEGGGDSKQKSLHLG